MTPRLLVTAILTLGVSALVAEAQSNAKRPIEEWIEAYKKNDRNADGQMRRAGESALPYLAMLIAHDDPDVRIRSFQHLGYLGPKAAPAIPQIVQALDHPDSSTRLQALHVLAAIGYSARDAEADVIAFYEKAPDREKPWVLRTLGYIGNDAKRLVPMARRHLADPESAASAAILLWRLDPTAKGKDVLAPFVNLAPRRGSNYDGVSTKQAVLMAPDYPEMASAFVSWLSEVAADRRAFGYRALADMGPEGKKQAAVAIAEILKLDGKQVPKTEMSLNTGKVDAALSALVQHGFDDELLLRTIARRLDEPMPRNLSTLLQGMQRLGDKAKPLAPQLEKVLRAKKTKDIDGYEALAIADPTVAVKFRGEIEELARSDPRKSVRAQAVLFRLESTPARLEPLLDAAKNRNHEAFVQIARLGLKVREALPILAALMNDPKFDPAIARAYLHVGGDAKRVAAAMETAFAEAPNKAIFIGEPNAVKLLADLGPAAKGIVPGLIAYGRQQGLAADWEQLARILAPIDRDATRRALRSWE
jgi:HEAT repeat protein